MKSNKPKQVTRLVTEKCPEIFVPNGNYSGMWSSYVVEFTGSDRNKYFLTMGVGIKGINIPCRVIVDKEGVKVELDD